ncbi:DMT family transporter [Marinomonas mediterranea]|uniref:EamA domain-containing protein n=1 Tax=Marinomonas mediterranea (strain ATCC 700492 / JCM 21426 / NBRC 103028 / MMB-1) TaxID=717774 RepID=F2JVM3_MARM1|nr:DMT family transporter [Marinomonas mediterranea]ADZ90567.1 protein of unknown function DUF6 transmembrane [Marinomonas mediterranea MMB-1]WCN08614.1 EamA family transporter [Marinomonas mediterranea]WCN16742.1 EamA family transporter [Marinomonas mediterranea MMB-1]
MNTEHLSKMKIHFVILVVLCAFALNSILCRLALVQTSLDPMSFTTLRLMSGALVLAMLVVLTNRNEIKGRSENRERGENRSENNTLCLNAAFLNKGWITPLALLAYAVSFSFAYVSLPAGIGALLLFGAVQFTMIGYGLYSGERLNKKQWCGLFVAIFGVLVLFLPGASAPSLIGSALMLVSGVGWAVYTVRGKGASNPIQTTGINFLKASILSLFMSLLFISEFTWDSMGALYALLAGGVTSGLGYALWYFVLPSLKVTTAATLQLSVPVIAIFMGVLLLGEQVTLHLFLSSLTILGGVFLYILAGMAPRVR